MFFTIRREERISLHPKYFHGDIQYTLKLQLKDKLEGKCSGRFGFTICILDNDFETHDGLLDVDTGYAQYRVKFFCLVFKPFKNEVLIATVNHVNASGIFCEAGPLEIFISQTLIPSHYYFDDLNVCYVSEEGDYKISRDTPLRVKLTGVRINASEIKSVGSIKGDMLGPFDAI